MDKVPTLEAALHHVRSLQIGRRNLTELEMALLVTEDEEEIKRMAVAARARQVAGTDIPRYFSDIVLVEKLAETRALTGFARINPPPMREFDRQDRNQLALNPVPWLPAIRVCGEGIFITLNREKLDAWSLPEPQPGNNAMTRKRPPPAAEPFLRQPPVPAEPRCAQSYLTWMPVAEIR